jgi:hypothetical protein
VAVRWLAERSVAVRWAVAVLRLQLPERSAQEKQEHPPGPRSFRESESCLAE